MKNESRKSLSVEIDRYQQYIISLLREGNWTHLELAQHAGVSRSAVERWLSGESLPSIVHRKRLREIEEELRREPVAVIQPSERLATGWADKQESEQVSG